jgi:hypothetical protein
LVLNLPVHAFPVFSVHVQNSSCIFSVYEQIFSAYLQYTYRFIQRSKRLWTAKFHVKIYLLLCALCIRTDSLCVFSVYQNRFSLCILSICTDLFHVFG